MKFEGIILIPNKINEQWLNSKQFGIIACFIRISKLYVYIYVYIQQIMLYLYTDISLRKSLNNADVVYGFSSQPQRYCMMYTVRCTQYGVQYTVYNYSTYTAIYMYIIRHTVYGIHCVQEVVRMRSRRYRARRVHLNPSPPGILQEYSNKDHIVIQRINQLIISKPIQTNQTISLEVVHITQVIYV